MRTHALAAATLALTTALVSCSATDSDGAGVPDANKPTATSESSAAASTSTTTRTAQTTTQAAAETTSDPAGSEDEIVAMSFNIHHGANDDDEMNLDDIAEAIDDADPDVVGLQEVDNNWDRSDFEAQADYLGEKLGMEVAFGDNLNVPGEGKDGTVAQYGNAILVKGSIVDQDNHYLPLLDTDPKAVAASRSAVEGVPEQRSILRVTADVKGQTIDFFTAHLEQKVEELRKKQAEDIVKVVGQAKNPAILVGDFNAEPDSAIVKTIISGTGLVDSFEASGEGDAVTYGGGSKRIDYILVDPDLAIDDVDVLTSDASDHFPITAELDDED